MEESQRKGFSSSTCGEREGFEERRGEERGVEFVREERVGRTEERGVEFVREERVGRTEERGVEFVREERVGRSVELVRGLES